MNVGELINENLIAVPFGVRTKPEAIAGLVDLVARSGLTADRDALLAAVLARENQRTTGIGRGFAIPHAKCESVTRLTLAFGRPERPIDYDSIDGKPVSLIALLVSPARDTGPHLLALAALSRIVTNDEVFNALLAAQDAAEFADIIRRREAR